ncbi:MAG: hypothetical protein AAGA58_02415 [Verrucomicrobiota bacterium]
MNLRSFRNALLPIAALATVAGVPSCKLPPREALVRIQQDTLVGYFATAQSESVARSAQQSVANVEVTETPHPNTVFASTPREIPTLAPSITSAAPRVRSRAEAVPGKPGYAYTPFVPGKKMVDVRSFNPGDKVLCPYTRKVFFVPSPVPGTTAPSSNVAATTSPPSQPSTVVRPRVNATPENKPASTTNPSNVAANNKPAPETPKKKVASTDNEAKAEPKKKVAENKPAPKPNANGNKKSKASNNMAASKPTEPKPESTPKPANDKPAPAGDNLPSGTPVPGKPNYVYSPFAKKNQIVDVQGMAPGTKVRCPYTGKLFLVP